MNWLRRLYRRLPRPWVKKVKLILPPQGQYPKGTRFVNDKVIVVERPPTSRTIFVNGRPIYLAFPYIVFVIPFCHCPKTRRYARKALFVGFRDSPLTASDDTLCSLPLPNYDSSTLSVCLGSGGGCVTNDLFGLVESTIAAWWNTSFDTSHVESPSCNRFPEWQKITRTKPKKVSSLLKRQMRLREMEKFGAI